MRIGKGLLVPRLSAGNQYNEIEIKVALKTCGGSLLLFCLVSGKKKEHLESNR
jgi:hypothetical protein